MPPVKRGLPVDGASVTTFYRYGDHRGYFNELYTEDKYDGVAPAERLKQVSFSSSQKKHALRGLHCTPYGNLVTCVRGSLYDVIADFRHCSPTFGRWCGVVLSETNRKQVYVPAGCGHGFFTFEDNTSALYMQEGTFDPANEADTNPFDPLFNVVWPVPPGVTPVMSPKDEAAPPLSVYRPALCGLAPRGRVLVVGGSGQVGGALIEAFGPRDCIGTYASTKVAGFIHFDLTQAALQPHLATELMQTVNPTLVCICAGFTWADGCEREPQKAHLLNCRGPAVLAAAAAAIRAKVVWYSSDYVFDGGVGASGRAGSTSAGPYSEKDAPAPLNVYGASKLAGEAAVLAADPSALVVRTNVVFGPESVGKNFVYQLLRKIRAGEPIDVPHDQARLAPDRRTRPPACTRTSRFPPRPLARARPRPIGSSRTPPPPPLPTLTRRACPAVLVNTPTYNRDLRCQHFDSQPQPYVNNPTYNRDFVSTLRLITATSG